MIIIPLSRREALARMIAAAALAGSLDLEVFAAGEPQGFGDDPNLLEKEIPWPRALSEGERRTTTALADVILPADELGPAASTVGVTDFIDEWVSAPYPQQQREGKIIREGLAWIETAAMKYFGKSFAAADVTEQSKLLDEIIDRQSGAHREGYEFFRLFRDRAAGAYFTTKEGWAAIGYTGNVPMAEFPGPPPEALRHVGLA
jgi:hypothetical protein